MTVALTNLAIVAYLLLLALDLVGIISVPAAAAMGVIGILGFLIYSQFLWDWLQDVRKPVVEATEISPAKGAPR